MIRNLLYIIILIILAACSNSAGKKKISYQEGIRIVSLAPSVSKEIQDLNMSDNIVGATSYCEISKTNKELIIGTTTEVNIEKILLLKPDIVFATTLTKESTVKSLTNNGIKVHQIKKLESFEHICSHFIKLGELVGKADLAQSIAEISKQKIDSLINIIPPGAEKPKVFFQIGAKPLFTVIPNTFMNDYIIMAGGENIATDFNKGTITRESVLKRNPDVIFIVTMGIIGDDEKSIWNSYKELKAAENNKIFIINSSTACSPTVLTYTKTLEKVINKIYL